jgi:hypothetical protein
MKVCRKSGASAGLLVAFTLAVCTQTTQAVVVFDDHFDGNSGGIPQGWSSFWGDGAIMESGTTVMLFDNCAIWTDQTVNPNAGRTTLTVQIAGFDARAEVDLLDSEDGGNHLFVKLWAASNPAGGSIDVRGCVAGGEEDRYEVVLPDYAGGPTCLTIVLEEATFSISTDSPPFLIGPIPYSAVFTGFTRAALGSAARLTLSNENHDFPSFSSYDRITMDVSEPTALDGASWGRVKTDYAR